MDIDRFWQIVETSTQKDPKSAEDWDIQLVGQLTKLPADEIV